MGQYASRLTCATCQNTSTTYETFTGISLEIPKTSRGDVHQCLRNWSKSEQLRPEDMWKCPKCKINKNASKQITITRAPHILVLQLKRFGSPMEGKIQKLTTDVSFPLNCLDIGPYTVPSINLSGNSAARFSQDHGQTLLDRVLKHELETSAPYQYELYGVVQHFGSLTSGHYIALIRGQGGQWWEHNDSHVSKFNTKKVESNAAYILFYQRINGRT
jgi:ubiquitin carboxyl-terminal hydrolase 8